MRSTHPINSVLNIPRIGTLQVVEVDDILGCEGCVFYYGGFTCKKKDNLLKIVGRCSPDFRSDHKNIIFKKIGGNND